MGQLHNKVGVKQTSKPASINNIFVLRFRWNDKRQIHSCNNADKPRNDCFGNMRTVLILKLFSEQKCLDSICQDKIYALHQQ